MNDRLLLVIDGAFELSSLSAALTLNGTTVVGEARNQSVAVNIFRSMQPDVVLIDMHSSNESSVDIAIALRKESATVGVVMLVPCIDLRLIGADISQLPAGSRMILRSSVNDLTSLCEVVTQSRSFATTDKAIWITSGISLHDKAADSPISDLSDIQVETLRYVADGFTNAEIGRKRFVSEKAVEQMLSRVAMNLNIQPDHRKNMRVQLVNEYMKWIGAPVH